MRLKHGYLFQFENNQCYQVLTHRKTLNVLSIIVYLHSKSQRFFVNVSFKFSNNRCRYSVYGNFAILLSLMQRGTDHLVTLQNFDF